MTEIDSRIAELQSHLLNHRDDEDSWLVLGDAYQEKGHPSGDMIVLEHMITLEKDEAKRREMEERLEILEKQHLELLIGPLANIPGATWEIKKGHLWNATIETDNLEELREVSDSPCCRMMSSLYLKGGVTNNMADCLSTITSLRLTSLNLYSNSIGDEGAKAIAQSESMRSLIKLDLSCNSIGDEGAKAIARSESMRSLTELYLWNNSIGDEGAKAIAQSESMRSLTELDLSCNSIGDEGAKAIAQSESMRSLTELDLSYNSIGDE